MKKEIADLWTTALRSGVYSQTRSKLKASNGECCVLGVLCEIATINNVIARDEIDVRGGYVTFAGADGQLPEKVRDWAGMRTRDGAIDNTTLVYLNDTAKRNFNDLAGTIERNYTKL
jgi:hypothetical protein